MTIRDADGRFATEHDGGEWSQQRSEWPVVPTGPSRATFDVPHIRGVVQDGTFIPMLFYHGSPSKFVRGRLDTVKAWVLGRD